MHTFLELPFDDMVNFWPGNVDADVFIVFAFRIGGSTDNVPHCVVGHPDEEVLVRARVGNPQHLLV